MYLEHILIQTLPIPPVAAVIVVMVVVEEGEEAVAHEAIDLNLIHLIIDTIIITESTHIDQHQIMIIHHHQVGLIDKDRIEEY